MRAGPHLPSPPLLEPPQDGRVGTGGLRGPRGLQEVGSGHLRCGVWASPWLGVAAAKSWAGVLDGREGPGCCPPLATPAGATLASPTCDAQALGPCSLGSRGQDAAGLLKDRSGGAGQR